MDFVCFESLGENSDYAPKEKASAITSIRILTYIIYSRWIVYGICRILSFAAIFTSYEVFYIRHENLRGIPLPLSWRTSRKTTGPKTLIFLQSPLLSDL